MKKWWKNLWSTKPFSLLIPLSEVFSRVAPPSPSTETTSFFHAGMNCAAILIRDSILLRDCTLEQALELLEKVVKEEGGE